MVANMKPKLVGRALLFWTCAVLFGCASGPDIPPVSEGKYTASTGAQRLALSEAEAYCTDYASGVRPDGHCASRLGKRAMSEQRDPAPRKNQIRQQIVGLSSFDC